MTEKLKLDLVVNELDMYKDCPRGIAIQGVGYLQIGSDESERIRELIKQKQDSLDLSRFSDGEVVGEITVNNYDDAEVEWYE